VKGHNSTTNHKRADKPEEVPTMGQKKEVSTTLVVEESVEVSANGARQGTSVGGVRVSDESLWLPVREGHSHDCWLDPAGCPDQLTCDVLATVNLAQLRATARNDLMAWEEEMAGVDVEQQMPSSNGEVDLKTLDGVLEQIVDTPTLDDHAVADVVQPELPVETPRDILHGVPETFDAVIPNLAFRALKTLLVGPSKAGKTYTTWAKLAEPVHAGTRVLYLSEEPRSTIADKLRTFGLADEEGFLVVRHNHPTLRDLRWSEVARRIETTALNHRADVVVVDTARPWFRLQGDESNNQDVIGSAIDALSRTAEAGVAVVILHQSPWEAKRARNSTEFHAASDLIFYVEGEGTGPRTVKYLGGRVENIPDVQTIRWAGGVTEDLGRLRHGTASHMDAVLTTLEREGRSMTVAELVDATDFSERSVNRWLGQLEERRKVSREPGLFTTAGREPDKWSRNGAWAEMYALLEVTDAELTDGSVPLGR
jgi:hypothetical protein